MIVPGFYKDVAPPALLPRGHKAGLLSQLARQGLSWGFPVWLASQDADKFLTQGTRELRVTSDECRIERKYSSFGIRQSSFRGSPSVSAASCKPPAWPGSFGRMEGGRSPKSEVRVLRSVCGWLALVLCPE